MTELEKQIAILRGEALAARLIASAALQTIISAVPNRLELLSSINAYVDNTLNMSGPADKAAHDDEMNTQMRETARFQTDQILQHLEQMIRSAPPRG